ncbi:MAG: metallophosphoesterase, partial [Bacteroidales bacterium]|nr:metallophosphoesterase [Bacteroidales bacterium]
MNEILIVPDVHGREFWYPALDFSGDVIFLGDYVDPYPAERISEEMAMERFWKIIEFKKQNSDRVTLLVGNHEHHYYDQDFEGGRKMSDYAATMKEILTSDETKHLFQLCKQTGKYLFIHAGITKDWYDRHYNDFKDLGETLEEQLNNLLQQENKHVFYEAGGTRGGWHKSGSPLWADVSEYKTEEEPFDENIIQIIGHTQNMKPDPIFIKNI